VDVINGYGKSLGLMQVAELGELETPIFLTNTLAVGAVQQGYLRHVRDRYAARPGRSLNVVVTECNDGYLNDLWGLHVRTEDAVLALQDADRQGPVEQGSVGAGTGMVAFGHKGGIGSASRRLGDGETMVGALVLLNCGRAGDLRVVGRPAPEGTRPVPEPAPGSVIVVLATNGLWDRHDLRRGVRRAVHGLARTGAASDPGSGDVALLFRTATEAAPTKATPPLDQLFRAVAEVTEAAVLNALVTATTVVGRDGNVAHALPDEALG
jgi:D-aminopeptidase